MGYKLSLSQLAHGKLVKSEGGPIRDGSDHGHTGHSRSFPIALIESTCPELLGLGFPAGRSVWNNYPWNTCGGGMVWRPLFSHEGAFVVVGRIRGRSEGGEGTSDRAYTEARYVAVPASAWTPDLPRALSASIRVAPLLEFDTDMPELEVERPEPLRLEGEWKDQLLGALARILRGQAHVVVDAGYDMDRFIRLVELVGAALPCGVAWRLPVGVGMWEPEPSLALACAARHSANPATVDPRDDEVGASAYLSWIQGICRGVATAEQLRERVRQAFPDLDSWSAVSLDADWRSMVTTLDAIAAKRQQLEHALCSGRDLIGVELLALAQLRSLHVRALSRALARSSQGESVRADELLGMIDTEWSSAWSEVSQGDDESAVIARSISALTGLSRVIDVHHVQAVRHIEFPEKIAERILGRLRTQYVKAASGSGADWISVLSPGPSACWHREFTGWLSGALTRTWLASAEPGRHLAWLAQMPIGRVVGAVIDGKPVAEEDLSGVLDAVAQGGAESLVRLIDFCAAEQSRSTQSRLSVGLMWLAEAAARKGGSSEFWMRTQLPDLVTSPWDVRQVTHLARDAIRQWNAISEMPAGAIRVLLAYWDSLPASDQEQLAKLIGDELESDVAVLVMRCRTKRSLGGRWTDVARAICELRVTGDDVLARQIVEGAFPSVPPKSHLALLRRWIDRRDPSLGAPKNATLAALLGLKRGGSIRPLASPNVNTLWVARIAEELGVSVLRRELFEAAMSPADCAALLLASAGRRRPDLCPRDLARFIEACAESRLCDGEGDCGGWHVRGWGLLAKRDESSRIVPLSSAEREVVQHLTPRALLWVMRRGVPVPQSCLAKIPEEEWRLVAIGEWTAESACMVSSAILARAIDVLRFIAVTRIRTLRASGRWCRDVEAPRGGSGLLERLTSMRVDYSGGDEMLDTVFGEFSRRERDAIVREATGRRWGRPSS